MLRPRWDEWSDTAKREALAVAVVLATTFGGWSTQHAQAATPASKAEAAAEVIPKAETPQDPIEAIFAFRDGLDRVQWQLGFEADARDVNEMDAACGAVVRDRPVFEAALPEIEDDVADKLRRGAAPTIELCESSGHARSARESAATDGYAQFWEAAFDAAA